MLVLLSSLPLSAALDEDLGRNEVRVYAAPFHIDAGRTISELDLPERLERLGYARRRGERPRSPGEYFFGTSRFWIYRREVRIGKTLYPPRLIGLELRDGLIVAGMDEREQPLHTKHFWIEPELLADSFDPRRALTLPVDFDSLPDHVWQAVLAAEDSRFFEHSGLDAKSLARAALRNARAGKVEQGGSTITQQLIKLRDLSPKRSLGRKASEALRALALEAEHDKSEILEAYLDAVYYGHIDGIEIYGLGAAARAFFSKPADKLGLEESVVLAAMIQGPNRLSPVRNPEAVVARYRWVLTRMVALDWLAPSRMHAADRRGLPPLHLSTPPLPAAAQFLAWLGLLVEAEAPKRTAKGRGAVVYSTLDPLLQEAAESAVSEGLGRLRRTTPALANRPLGAALVAVDARNGDILAYVGGDPRLRFDRFDRARRARRQPGSTVKPFVLLEAFERCGRRSPLYPARRVSDRPLTVDLASGSWSPENPDHRFRDSVTLRQATVQSLNVPMVRTARWCGFDNTAERFRASGLTLPAEVPPAFVLGAVETTPIELAGAYTVFGNAGRSWSPRPYDSMLQPNGDRISRRRPTSHRVVHPATAYLVRDVLEDSVDHGTARAARIADREVFGKTGTSSDSRDAWFAGGAGSVVAAVWVGLDDDQRLGLSGAAAAAPIWKAFMETAIPRRAPLPDRRPSRVVERWIEVDTGLLVAGERSDAVLELFIASHLPPRRRLFKRDRPVPVLE